MGDHFGIGVAGELDAVAFEFGAQDAVVLDDAVVDYCDASGRIGVRVGIPVVRGAVGGPARVPHAGRAGDGAAGELLVEVLDSPGFLGDLQRAVAADDRDARRVVPPVFQPAQPLDDDVKCLPGTDVTHDAAHPSQPTGADQPPLGVALGDPSGGGTVVGVGNVAVGAGVVGVALLGGALVVLGTVVDGSDGVLAGVVDELEVLDCDGAGVDGVVGDLWLPPNRLLPLPEWS